MTTVIDVCATEVKSLNRQMDADLREADELLAMHRGIQQAGVQLLEDARKLGDRLIQKKDSLAGRGEWTQWVTQYLPDIGQRHATNYMRISREWESLQAYLGEESQQVSLRGAIAYLQDAQKAELSQQEKDAVLASYRKIGGRLFTRRGKYPLCIEVVDDDFARLYSFPKSFRSWSHMAEHWDKKGEDYLNGLEKLRETRQLDQVSAAAVARPSSDSFEVVTHPEPEQPTQTGRRGSAEQLLSVGDHASEDGSGNGASDKSDPEFDALLNSGKFSVGDCVRMSKLSPYDSFESGGRRRPVSVACVVNVKVGVSGHRYELAAEPGDQPFMTCREDWLEPAALFEEGDYVTGIDRKGIQRTGWAIRVGFKHLWVTDDEGKAAHDAGAPRIQLKNFWGMDQDKARLCEPGQSLAGDGKPAISVEPLQSRKETPPSPPLISKQTIEKQFRSVLQVALFGLGTDQVRNIVEAAIAEAEPKAKDEPQPEESPQPEIEFSSTVIDDDVLEVLRGATGEENRIYLNSGQLERKLYQKTDKVIAAMGGKWTGRKVQAHVFDEGVDAARLLELVVEHGKVPAKNPLAFFETPPEEAQQLVSHLGLENAERGDIILEPSCGNGALLREISKVKEDCGVNFQVMACELDKKRAAAARKLKIAYVINEVDFLDWAEGCHGTVQKIAMNPPFSVKDNPTAYVDHIMAAWDVLAEGGTLAAIAPAGLAFRNDKKVRALRQLVLDHGQIIDRPQGSFSTSGTGVSTVFVVLHKPVED